ncbi:non-ribosomal peptide synthetase module [Lutibacter sp. B2]|nr:non-ribosomal peptide synthetase module [Lutibacter sp. B2]
MNYNQEEVIQAFKIYSKLSIDGYSDKDEIRLYLADDSIRGLVDQFAREVDSTVFVAGDYIYLVPLSMNSSFHVSNETIKRTYLPSKAVNLDIYMMYVAIIVLFGEFYDSYQTNEPTRDFLPLDEWLISVNNRISLIKEYDQEELKEYEKEYEYNWLSILEKWDAKDDLKENVKTQDARTNSRLSFLNIVKRFLEAQELIVDIGNDEIALTEKAKTIVQRYYMEYEYNRGILEFMYQFEQKKGESKDASNL